MEGSAGNLCGKARGSGPPLHVPQALYLSTPAEYTSGNLPITSISLLFQINFDGPLCQDSRHSSKTHLSV